MSAAPFDSLNLGRAGGVAAELSDPQANLTENLRRFQAAVGVIDRPIARVHQVHGAAVVDATACSSLAMSGRDGAVARDASATALDSRSAAPDAMADALVAIDAAPALMITVADCAPILIACPRSGVISAIHAGWRGVVAGVIDAAITRMAALGAERSELRAAIGPCIGIDAFEVGDEVADAFAQVDLCSTVRRSTHERAHIDLSAAVEQQLRRAGVLLTHIDRSERCTVTDAHDFFSYRRDGARSGRMAAIIARAGSTSNDR